ncbi:S-layer homology domain-containing protein [Intestinibacillus massiliensis]|uniref:S-layer homology domain-containing protein n=1 Tax=Intestinibacillus massiliensis TaxID=1871029 RepID=UPI000B359E7D|nr:S-layer homology domain-containing protein [Intestinibacillus massiliensis]
MKNLKKVLALVMAFAMAFTMMAGAAFTDQADIKATEAVDMLTALNVINGNPDGSFNPDGTVTRAEMAKMIYVLRTGKDTADNFSTTPTTFTDINGHWAAGFIKYCQTMGIIAGESATKFNPDGTVTGTQAAKMLLVTIGYDQTKAGLVGTGWDTKTNALASENGLLDDVDSDLNAGLPRQYAAQLIYNAIDAETVMYNANGQVVKTEKTENSTVAKPTGESVYYYSVYKYASAGVLETVPAGTGLASASDAKDYAKEVLGLSGTATGTTTNDYKIVRDSKATPVYTYVNETNTKNETVGEKYLDLKKTTGVLMAAGNTTLNPSFSSGDNVLKLAQVDPDEDEGSKWSFTKVKTDLTSLLGQRVKVLYKNTDNVYGVYVVPDCKVITGKASDLDTVSGEEKVKIDGTKYKFDDSYDLYNGTATYATGSASNVAAYVNAVKDSDFDMYAVDLDNDGNLDMIRVIPKRFAKLTSVSSSAVYVNYMVNDVTTNTQKFDMEDDNPEIYDGAKKDDYVLVSTNEFTGDPKIEAATVVEGKATSTKDNKVQIDGNWYNLKWANKDYQDIKLDNSYKLQTYGSYAYYVGGSTSAADLDVLLVKNVGDPKTLDKGVEAKVLFEDGTEKVINVVKSGSTVWSGNGSGLKSAISNDTLYEYSEDDGDYTLKAITAGTSYTDLDGNVTDFGVKALTTGTARTNGYHKDSATVENYDIAKEAVVFLRYQNSDHDYKYKVMSGSALMTYSNMQGRDVSGFVMYDTNDKDYAKIIYINYDAVTSSGDSLYAMITGVQFKKNADGDKVAYFDMLTKDGEKTAVESDKTSTNLKKGDIVEITGSWEKISDITQLTTGTYDSQRNYGAVKNDLGNNRVSFESLTADTLENGKITGDTHVIYVDQSKSDYAVVDNGSIQSAQANRDTNGNVISYKANAFAKINNDGEFDVLVIEVSNEMKDRNGNVVTLAATPSTGTYGVTYGSVTAPGSVTASAITLEGNAKSNSNGSVTVTVKAAAEAGANCEQTITLNPTVGTAAGTVTFTKAEQISGSSKTVVVSGITADTTINASASATAVYTAAKATNAVVAGANTPDISKVTLSIDKTDNLKTGDKVTVTVALANDADATGLTVACTGGTVNPSSEQTVTAGSSTTFEITVGSSNITDIKVTITKA